MTLKQTPHVVVSAIWPKVVRKNGVIVRRTAPIRKQVHFVMAHGNLHASEKFNLEQHGTPGFNPARQVWLIKTTDSEPHWEPKIDEMIVECFAEHMFN